MIYTFYSYKGGVGRSMAMANIAELLYAQGLKVLMIDWDLEAPGLERYFPIELESALKQPGVMDMVSDYKRALAAPPVGERKDDPELNLPDIDSYLLDVYPDEQRSIGKLWLMPAGRRVGDDFDRYGKLVRMFDWEDFYQNWEGEAFLEWFRREIDQLTDAVVIDSRTGVTEMGGICTYQLADAVVMFCGSNAQSLDGTFSMAQEFKDPELVGLRRGRPLAVLVVPARIEDRAEARDLSIFRNDFLRRFSHDQFFGERALAASAVEMWDLKIPHVPYYAFRETVMVRDAQDIRHPDMYRALTNITGTLILLSPQDSALRERTAALVQRFGPVESKSLSIFNAPRANPSLVGRDAVLESLESALAGNGQAAPIAVVTGLGGVGTTALVIEYAHRHQREYDVVWWIRADDEATLNSDYARLAEALKLPEQSSPDQTATLAAVRMWLERNHRWLLIFDNAMDPQLVIGALPRTGGGHVLVTSRNPNWGRDAAVLPLAELSRAESVEFLLKRTGDKDTAAAEALAELLGDLPLALEQAAAYVAESGLTIARYLRLFQERSVDLLHRSSAGADKDTVATIWQLSFDRVRQNSPSGAALLRLCAFLAPDDIPRDIFSAAAGQLPADLSEAASDPLAFEDAVAALRRYSLIRATEDSLSVHRLVQAVVRQRLRGDAVPEWAAAAVRLLHSVFPENSEDVSTWPSCSRLLPHALAATDHAEELGAQPDETSWVLDRVACYLKGRAQFTAAKRCFERAVSISTASRGPHDPALSVHLMHLGSTLRELGDLSAAEGTYRKALAIAESAHGPGDLLVADILQRIGRLLRILGRLQEARAALERALSIAEAAYGPDHSAAGATLSQLGRVLALMGELTGAEACFRRALAIAESSFGAGHPKVAGPLSDLGRVISQLGRGEEAKQHFERALAIAEAAYGPNHPKVSAILDDLGKVLRQLGRPAESRDKHEAALAIDEQAYGPDHLNVANDHQNLGNALCDLGDLVAARVHLERALAITESALGAHHPAVAEVLNDLGHVQRGLGDLDRARAQFERAFSILEDAYGPDHPDVAIALNNLGRVLSQIGDLDAARAALEQSLAVSEHAYGSNHPQVGAALTNLGRVLEQLGDFQAAKLAYERALSIARTVYGASHPAVADGLDNLGLVLNEVGDPDGAKRNLEEAVTIFEAALGPSHPTVAVALVHLASVIEGQRNHSVAQHHLRRALTILTDAYGPEHPSVVRTRQLLDRIQERSADSGAVGGSGAPARLAVETINDDDQDMAQIAELTKQLRMELLELDVDAVDLVRVENAPGGTKGVEAQAPGSLAVTVARTPGTLGILVRTLGSWLRRGRSRSIKLELDGDVLELSGITSEEQDRLISAWIARHSN